MQFIFGFPEVLKQVWDLSDQDNDSMLSLREFCIALYLMERHREGRSLPSVLPANLIFDELPLPASGQPTGSHGMTAWRNTPGILHPFYTMHIHALDMACEPIMSTCMWKIYSLTDILLWLSHFIYSYR